MRATLGVLFGDEIASIDPALQLALKQLPTTRLISEAELDHNEPHNKAALILVQESGIASALVRITALKKRLPSLRIVVAIQAMSAANLRQLVDAGADSFVTQRPAPNELHAALAPAPTAAEEPDLDLTRRETEILRLLSSGFSNKDVARRLDLSVRTVETHRLNLRRKTQTGRLKDLIALARTLRLTPVHEDKSPEKHRLAQ